MSSRSLKAKLVASPYIVWSAIFIIAPLIFVAYYAFTDANGAFTFENVFELSKYTTTFLRSIWFGIVATLICLIIAFPLAYFMSNMKAGPKRMLSMLIMVPM